MSKSLAPGYRVGWIVPGSCARQVMDRKLAYSLCGPVLPQVAMAGFLASGAFDAHMRRLRRLLEENLLRLTRAIEASFPPDTRVSRPAGGLALWVELPRGFDSRALFDTASEHGICFAPGDVFSASRRFRNCMRLSAGSAWNERLEQGVARLGELARAQPRVRWGRLRCWPSKRIQAVSHGKIEPATAGWSARRKPIGRLRRVVRALSASTGSPRPLRISTARFS